MDDKNWEVNHEEFEEKNEEIFREDGKNEEEDVNLNVDEKNDVINKHWYKFPNFFCLKSLRWKKTRKQ